MKAKIFLSLFGLIGCFLLLFTVSNTQATIIDDFNSYQFVSPFFTSSSLADASVIGGYRYMKFISQTPSDPFGTNLTSNSAGAPSELSLSNGTGYVSKYQVIWGGSGNPPTGFPPVDIMEGNVPANTYFGIVVTYIDQGKMALTIDITDNSNNTATWYFTVTGPIGSATTFKKKLSDFTNAGSVDFSQTKMVSLTLETLTQSTDISLHLLQTEPIPEPGTLILIGSGLVALAGYGRLRFRKKN